MGKRQNIIEAATRLFARQGFDATTTAQIAAEGNFTEPLLYYHFDGKDALFTHIIRTIFEKYISRLESLPTDPRTQFEFIENLIVLHFRFVREMPEETLLVVSACPSKLSDPDGICANYIIKVRKWLMDQICAGLKKGIASGEFRKVPVKETAAMLVALLNGLMRQHSVKLSKARAAMSTTVEFCRRSLVNPAWKAPRK